MARFFAPISEADLEAKINKAFIDSDSDCIDLGDRFNASNMVDKLGKDLKVKFDLEELRG